MTVAAGTGVFAGVVALALLVAGWRRGRPAADLAWEMVGWMGLCALTCWLYAPYLGGTLVGAGDAYHYALQVADYVTQLRTGHFPIFVGGSAYGFNGNIHTLRTAPYFLHFAGLVDLLTARSLTFPELLDLTVLLHALGAAFSAWRVARFILNDGNRKYAVGLAALYVLSPGVAGTVQAFDLVATFMTLPWLPVLLGAMVMLLEGEIWRGTIIGTWALAILWWAHPAIGIWGTVLWGFTGIIVVIRLRSATPWRAAALSAAGLAAMSAYCFVSVRSLRLGYDLGNAAAVRADIVAAVSPLWPDFIFHPLNDPARTLWPGYPLWIFGLFPLVPFRIRSDAHRLIAFCMLGLLLLIGLVPFLTPWLWALVPNPVLQVINTSIVSRSPAMLAALLVAMAALGLRALAGFGPAWRRAVGVAFAGAIIWGMIAVGPVRRGAIASAWTPAATAEALDPRNAVLTRSSYEMFGYFPSYFTDGRTSAPWEVRLLDVDHFKVVTTNAAAVVSQAQARGYHPPWLALGPAAVPIATASDRGEVLEFSFGDAEGAGDILLRGQSLFRRYTLPRSGHPAAFGSEPGNSRLIGFMPGEHDGRAIAALATVTGASVRGYPFAAAELPLQVEALAPLRVRVDALQSAWLESPLVWIPGYRATVDGAEMPVVTSPERMAMVRVPAGVHVAEFRYVPPPALAATYVISLLTLAGWTCLVLTWRQPRHPGDPLALRRVKKWSIRAGLGALLAAAGAIGAVSFLHRPLHYGAVHLTLQLPWKIPPGSEPLLVTGRTGAADVVYMHYLTDRSLQVGFDEWGVGGAESVPIRYWPGEVVQIDLAYATLFTGHPTQTPPRFRDPRRSPVVVRWNGQSVLDSVSRVSVGTGAAPAVGVNAIGASSCSARFTGEIRQVSRLGATDLPGK